MADCNKWTEIHSEILRRLDLNAEAEALGVKFSASAPGAKGWRSCHAIDREDNNPSAAVNVASTNGQLGLYKDAGGGGSAISFFDLAAKAGRFGSWREARDHYAQKAGVELPRSARQKQDAPHGLQWSPEETQRPVIEQWATYKSGVTAEAALKAGAKAAIWAKRHRVVVVTGYLPGEWNKPAAWLLMPVGKKEFPAYEPKGKKQGLPPRKTHLLKGSKNSLIIVGAPADLEQAAIVWKCEGPSDAIALGACLPAGHIAVTNTHGAGAFGPELAKAFAGKRLYIVHDADNAGEKGAEKVAECSVRVADEVRIVRLPYPIEDKHGKDVRDFLMDGRTFDDLVALAEKASPVPNPPEVTPWPLVVAEKVWGGDTGLLALDDMTRTELGNARRLARRHVSEIRYCADWKKWLAWREGCWRNDEVGDVRELAKGIVDSLAMEANAYRGLAGDKGYAQAKDRLEDLAEEVKAFTKRSSTSRAMDGMLKLAQSDPDVAVLSNELDKDPWLLNAANGTIDLRTGELRPHRKEDLNTKLCPVEYDCGADCPTWLSFLDEIFTGDEALIGYVRRAIGYSLTGKIADHALFFCYGTGGNGKSVFFNTILAMLGDDYAVKAPTNLLVPNKTEHSTIKTTVFGKRLAVCVEAEGESEFAAAAVKELTGGDSITARRMHENFWTFKPTHKIWLGANDKPKIRSTDHGMWRRVRVIPFTVTIPKERQDRALEEKLQAELPGILLWAVTGCIEWQAVGLSEPAAVRDATENYRDEQDAVGQFIDDCCIVAPDACVSSTELYEAYGAWCRDEGERRESQRAFSKHLALRRFERRHTRWGNKWHGVALQVAVNCQHSEEM